MKTTQKLLAAAVVTLLTGGPVLAANQNATDPATTATPSTQTHIQQQTGAKMVNGTTTGTQQAQSLDSHIKQSKSDLAKMDTNRDQKLSKDEAKQEPQLAGVWEVVDVNQDGSIDTAEFALFRTTAHIPADQVQNTANSTDQTDKTATQSAQQPGKADQNKADKSS